VDTASEDEVKIIVERFSQTFAQINAAVEKRGGVLKKVTYHLTGSDMMIMFGVPVAHSNDPIRAADAALAIRDIVLAVERPEIQGRVIEIKCRIGMSLGPVFAAEIGEPRGRREFNALGDTVNTAARLMGSAGTNMIYMTEDVHEWVKERFECADLGELPLKGKSIAIDIFELKEHRREED
jgi:class 3 adenylate cyclase